MHLNDRSKNRQPISLKHKIATGTFSAMVTSPMGADVNW